MDTSYQCSDAWLLLATIYAGRGQPAALSDVIAAADYIQHAIVAFEEMEGALARLTAGDFLADSGGRLSPSPKTMAFYQSVTKPRCPVHKEEEDIERLLNASSRTPLAKPQDANRGVSYPSLTREQFDEAVQDYLSRFPKLAGVKKEKNNPTKASSRRPKSRG